MLGLLLWPSGAVGQRPSFGPLTYEEGSPLQRLAFTPIVEGAEVLEPGRVVIETYNGFSNIFEQDSTATHVLFVDMERLTSALGVRWGFGEGWEAGARVAFETTGGGALDQVILDWHNAWGFGNANRDRFPNGVHRQWLTDGNGSVFLDRPAQTLALRDVRGFLKWRAWRSSDARSVVSLRSELRVPAVSPPTGNDRPDVALTALGRWGVGSWYLHGTLGASLTRRSDALAPVLRRSTRYLSFTVERSLGASLAALAQFQVQSAALRNFEHRELDRAPTSLLFGLAGRFGEAWSWDASFQEDVPADTPAVDFTITLRVSRAF